jgi:hypothetical protein
MELARQTIMIRGVHRLSNEKSVTEADLKARYDKFAAASGKIQGPPFWWKRSGGRSHHCQPEKKAASLKTSLKNGQDAGWHKGGDLDEPTWRLRA